MSINYVDTFLDPLDSPTPLSGLFSWLPFTVAYSALHCFTFLNLELFVTERYFRCEPMDATVSPIALTSQTPNADNSNGSSSNPGTPN